MQDLLVILRGHYLQNLNMVLAFFIELKFCKSDFYSLNSLKICVVATYNFGSVYMSHDKSEVTQLVTCYCIHLIGQMHVSILYF